jgi:SAM-dependent methyltransferase
MNLHNLVKLRIELEQAMNLDLIESELLKNSMRIRDLTALCDAEYAETLNSIADQHAGIVDRARLDRRQIQHTIHNITQDINILAERFFKENYDVEKLRYNSPESIRESRILKLPTGVDHLLLSRIQLYSSWKYPALEIGCRDGEWTRSLIASDPLYIADIFDEFLVTAVSQFEPVYRGRVRKYLIKDFSIPGLPVKQFGFIFSYNFFNYVSIDTLKQYLIQALDWLRPGGVMLFTYNNADVPAAATYAENYYMSYVPKNMLIPLCESLGYQVIQTHDSEPAVSWIEIRKPGELSTIKAGQALGEIKTIRH